MDARQKRRFATGFFLGVGVAMNALAFTGSRHGVQRVLFIVAGVLFIVAAIAQAMQTGGSSGTG